MTSSRDRSLAAIVLAAGYSSRMGSLKPLLPLWGSTVIAHGIAAFREAGVEPTIVLGNMAEEVRRSIAGLRVRCVINQEYDSGMHSSVVAGPPPPDPGGGGRFLLPPP